MKREEKKKNKRKLRNFFVKSLYWIIYRFKSYQVPYMLHWGRLGLEVPYMRKCHNIVTFPDIVFPALIIIFLHLKNCNYNAIQAQVWLYTTWSSSPTKYHIWANIELNWGRLGLEVPYMVPQVLLSLNSAQCQFFKCLLFPHCGVHFERIYDPQL